MAEGFLERLLGRRESGEDPPRDRDSQIAADAEEAATLALSVSPPIQDQGISFHAPEGHFDQRGATFIGTYIDHRAKDQPEPTLERPLVRIGFARHSHFVGRDAELEDLTRGLPSPGGEGTTRAVTNLALAGLGGVGKTQLVVEHAYRSIDQGRLALVWWVRAEDPSLISEDLAILADQVGVGITGERADSAANALAWLRSCSVPWLLIYDNAQDPGSVGEWLPKGGTGQVLITSRHGGSWQGVADQRGVGTLDIESATQFILDRTKGEDRDAARALAARLGGHALALTQATSLIADAAIDVPAYLKRLQDSTSVLDQEADTGDYQQTVAAVITDSRGRAEEIAPGSGELLDLIAYLDADGIPRELIEAHDDLPGLDPDLLDRAIPALKRLSLIEVEASTLRLHRLTQELTRAGHDGGGWLAQATHCLRERFPGNSTEPEAWPRCAVLAPQVIALAEITTDDHAGPELSWLLDRLGGYLRYRGDLRESTPFFVRALDIDRRLHGEEHPNTLASMNNLAVTLSDQGDLAAARELQEQTLEVSRRVLGEEHPNTLIAMNQLASSMASLGDLIRARAMSEQVVETSTRVLGEEHPDTLTAMSNLALTLRAQGDLPAARELQERVLEVSRRLLGEEHPDTLITMNQLASSMALLGDLERARAMSEQVVETSTRVLGEEHPDTLTAMNGLALTLRAQGDLAGARELQERVLALRPRVLGEEHPDTLASMNNLASTLSAQGDLAGARELQERVLALRRRVLGEEHPGTLTAMSNLALTLSAQGDLAGARELLQQALARARRTWGEEHPSTQIIQRSLNTLD